MQLTDLVAIGTLGKAPEKDGSIFFQENEAFIPAFLSVSHMFLVFKNHSVRYMTVTGIRQGSGTYITFAESDDLQDALAHGPVSVMLTQEDVIRIQEEEGIVDFTGMTVVFDDAEIGSVEDIMETRAHDILEVITSEEKEILIPVVEYYIQAIDVENRVIYVQHIEGLMEL
jgi:16S rRNA processing protein RimM